MLRGAIPRHHRHLSRQRTSSMQPKARRHATGQTRKQARGNPEGVTQVVGLTCCRTTRKANTTRQHRSHRKQDGKPDGTNRKAASQRRRTCAWLAEGNGPTRRKRRRTRCTYVRMDECRLKGLREQITNSTYRVERRSRAPLNMPKEVRAAEAYTGHRITKQGEDRGFGFSRTHPSRDSRSTSLDLPRL
jgi:hypothetical protein